VLTISDTCTGLPNDSLKTATTFPVDYGVVLTVSCSDLGYSLFGSEYITCIKGTKFSFVVTQPVCRIGESEINIFGVLNFLWRQIFFGVTRIFWIR